MNGAGDDFLEQVRIRVGDLTYLDKLEFEQQATALGCDADGDIEFEERKPPPGAKGEPVTLTVIIALAALKGLVAFLTLRARQDKFDQQVEIEYPDGTRVKKRITFTLSHDRDVSDQVIEHLSSLPGLPAGALDQYVG